MNTLLTIINDGDKLFDETFDNVNTTIVKITSELGFIEQKSCVNDIKDFIHSRELALVEGLKRIFENEIQNIRASYIHSHTEECRRDELACIEMEEISKRIRHALNEVMPACRAELDEAITHLKEMK